MPIYEPDHVEYSITNGNIKIVMDDGTQLPAYWAHPQMGRHFPGAVIIHDWWGLNTIIRRIANLFAQMGHYVIVPDLFDGQLAHTPQEAMRLVEQLGDNGYPRVNTALSVLENHHQCNADVAAVGIGMGGSLAFEAAITRNDLEVAIAYSGFPYRYFNQFNKSNTPIYAFYGSDDPHIKKADIQKLQRELSAAPISHKLQVVEGMGHELFKEGFSPEQRDKSRDILKQTFDFLDDHLQRPDRHSTQSNY